MPDEIIEFLSDFRWVYNFKWTEISIVKPWKNFPELWTGFLEGLSFEELQKLVLCDFSFKTIPEDIKNFFQFHKKLTNQIDNSFHSHNNKNLLIKNFRKINPKKRHEIVNITGFIGQYFEKNYQLNSRINVLDIGSGLGHLPRLLADNFRSNYEFSVLSVEGNVDLHTRNEIVTNDNGTNDCDYSGKRQKLNYFITENNLNEFHERVHLMIPQIDLVIGLHCCGSLSCLVIDYFSRFSSGQALLLFSCCYHRMCCRESDQLTGFPLSRVYQLKSNIDFVSDVFLRLGCQETKETWLRWTQDDCWYHQCTVAFRSALEIYQRETGDRIDKKLIRMKFPKENIVGRGFVEVVRSVLKDRLTLVKNPMRLFEIIEEQSASLQWFSVMLTLQMAIQEIVEYFILLDRVLFLRQFSTIESVELVKLFDSAISPRSIAIFAKKS